MSVGAGEKEPPLFLEVFTCVVLRALSAVRRRKLRVTSYDVADTRRDAGGCGRVAEC